MAKALKPSRMVIIFSIDRPRETWPRIEEELERSFPETPMWRPCDDVIFAETILHIEYVFNRLKAVIGAGDHLMIFHAAHPAMTGDQMAPNWKDWIAGLPRIETSNPS